MAADSIKIRAVGDLAFGELDVRHRHGVATFLRKRGLGALLEGVRELLSADFVFGNLETSIIKTSAVATSMVADPDQLVGIDKQGFSVLNVANNHIAEHGAEGVDSTLGFLRQRGIKTIGEAPDKEYSCKPLLTESGIGTIGWLGYSLIPDKNCNGTYAYVSPDESHRIISDVSRLAKECSHIVVSLHWGDEFVDHPSPSQIKFARSVIDAGASIVLGHHPHILQGFEHYGAGVIFYSLGNFVFDYWQERLRRTAVADITITPHGTRGRLILVSIGDDLVLRQPSKDDIGAWQPCVEGLCEKIDSTADETAYATEAKAARRQWRTELRKYYAKNFWRLGVAKNVSLFRGFVLK